MIPRYFSGFLPFASIHIPFDLHKKRCAALLMAIRNVAAGSAVVLLENEVDGLALYSLTESDVSSMFPGKIGVSKKLITLLKTLTGATMQVCLMRTLFTSLLVLVSDYVFQVFVEHRTCKALTMQ